MKIWVDADACPTAVREILFRAATRTGLEVIFVANQHINVPASQNVQCLRVPQGFDKADNEIVKRVFPGDLVITSDIPLASDVLDKEGLVLTPRGERYTSENIKARLGIRDFMETLRASGIQSGGQSAYSSSDKQAFANQLDRLIARAKR